MLVLLMELFMKYTAEMVSDGMIYTQSLTTIGSSIRVKPQQSERL
jgi:hypothetical protein